MTQSLCVVIVEKNGTLKSSTIKDFKEEDLFKKCGFKKGDDFLKQHEWKVKTGGAKYFISVYAKTEGRANTENKYDFPPPIDSTLFFGNCVIVAKNDAQKYIDLSLDLWTTIYEKLFGGFEDLAATALEDEQEEDELANVPKEKKTKDGYLKDGFVVDTSESDEEDAYNSSNDSDDDGVGDNDDDDADDDDNEVVLEDIGSELSEEQYDYDSDSDSDNK
jgi:hypothetical protein